MYPGRYLCSESASGSVSQRYGTEDSHPHPDLHSDPHSDPYQNVTDS
jgi:hypothetical protein